jgi:phage protein D
VGAIMKVKSIKDAVKKKAAKTDKVVDIRKAAKKTGKSSDKVAAKNKATKPEKAEDICELAVKTEEDTKKMMFHDIIDIAARMGIDARDLDRTELVRSIQRAEGYSDCFMTGQVKICGQMNCLWYQECVLC